MNSNWMKYDKTIHHSWIISRGSGETETENLWTRSWRRPHSVSREALCEHIFGLSVLELSTSMNTSVLSYLYSQLVLAWNEYIAVWMICCLRSFKTLLLFWFWSLWSDRSVWCKLCFRCQFVPNVDGLFWFIHVLAWFIHNSPNVRHYSRYVFKSLKLFIPSQSKKTFINDKKNSLHSPI